MPISGGRLHRGPVQVWSRIVRTTRVVTLYSFLSMFNVGSLGVNDVAVPLSHAISEVTVCSCLCGQLWWRAWFTPCLYAHADDAEGRGRGGGGRGGPVKAKAGGAAASKFEEMRKKNEEAARKEREREAERRKPGDLGALKQELLELFKEELEKAKQEIYEAVRAELAAKKEG